MMRHRLAFSTTALLLATSCIGTTGGGLVSFEATASGPSDATAGAALVFDNGANYEVSLTRARLHVGALYLNVARPLQNAVDSHCFTHDVYAAQILYGMDVDALSPLPQAFPQPGEGKIVRAVTGVVWLNGGAIDDLSDDTVIADFAGTATSKIDAKVFPFEGKVTIGTNRRVPPISSAQPGTNTICRQRIVSPINVDITPAPNGVLHLEVNPRRWFEGVDFSELKQVSVDPPLYQFEDKTDGQPNIVLFSGLHAAEDAYKLEWIDQARQSPTP